MARRKRAAVATRTQIVRAPAPTIVVAPRATRRRRAGAIVRRVGGVARRAASRGASVARERESQILTVLGGVALGYCEGESEKTGKPRLELPTVGKTDAAIITGAALAFGPSLLKMRGKWGRRISDVGIGVLTVGANRSMVRGSISVEGEEEDIDD